MTVKWPDSESADTGSFPQFTAADVSPGYDSAFDVDHLENMVERGLKYLQMACAQMEQVDRDLQEFLSEYHEQVGHFFDQLEGLYGQIKGCEQLLLESRKRPSDGETGKDLDVAVLQLREGLPILPIDWCREKIDAEIEDIYSQLMRLCRNDRSGKGEAIRPLIVQAYNRKNLWAMCEMEHRLVEHANSDERNMSIKARRLRERFESLAQSVTKVVERKTRLEDSVAWRLKNKMAQDSYFAEVIIHRVKQKIEDAQQLLVRRQIECRGLAHL